MLMSGNNQSYTHPFPEVPETAGEGTYLLFVNCVTALITSMNSMNNKIMGNLQFVNYLIEQMCM